MVDSEPEWPVLSACSRSNASPPRTSPTMMRSGRCRRVARSNSRMVTAGRPACSRRASNRTRFGLSICSSAVSSMRTMRSFAGRNAASAFRSVVLPVLVPPLIRMFSLLSIAARMVVSTPGVIVPIRTSSSAVKNRVWNLRMVSVVPPRLHGGKTAATREPSGRRESRIGFSSETSSPSARAMFLTATLRLRSSSRTSVTSSNEPVALDEDSARPIDHDLADVRILDQVRDRPKERKNDVEAHVRALPSRRGRSSSSARRGTRA